MFRQKIFGNFKDLSLQLVDLMVSLKLREENVRYHFTCILFMKGSRLFQYIKRQFNLLCFFLLRRDKEKFNSLFLQESVIILIWMLYQSKFFG